MLRMSRCPGLVAYLEDMVEGLGNGENGYTPVDVKNTHLSVYRKGITYIRPGIQSMTYATSLNFSCNYLTKLQSAMGDMIFLKALYVKSNRIEDLPSSFSNLTRLTHLNISDNRFTCVPDALKDLTSLECLHMDSNPFEEDIVFPESWTCLRIVHISECNQKIISPTINHLKSLKELNIGGNFWITLPPLEELDKLTDICMDNMKVKLDSLPESLALVRSLRRIDCNNSGLCHFPEWLIKEEFESNTEHPPVDNLDWLGLADNQIAQIPKAVAKLSKLDTLIVKGNPIKSFPVALHEHNPDLNLVVASNSDAWPELTKKCSVNARPPLSLLILAGQKVASQKLDLCKADLPKPCLKLIQTAKECSTLHCKGTFIKGGGIEYQNVALFPSGRGSTHSSNVLVDIHTCDISCTKESPKHTRMP